VVGRRVHPEEEAMARVAGLGAEKAWVTVAEGRLESGTAWESVKAPLMAAAKGRLMGTAWGTVRGTLQGWVRATGRSRPRMKAREWVGSSGLGI
jgi:hypothetical protein